MEYRLIHAAASDRRGTLLTEYPAKGVGDVGLATPVWTHDGRDPVVKLDFGLVGERFEPTECQRVDLHGATPDLVMSSALNSLDSSMSPMAVAASSDS